MVKALAGLGEKITIVLLAGGVVPLAIIDNVLSQESIYWLVLTFLSAAFTIIISYYIKEPSHA